MGIQERSLVRRLRAGDHEACRTLVTGHYDKVYAYLRWLGANRELAEDLTQETYAAAWRGLDGLRDAGSVRAWLLRIARNEYLQWRRRPSARIDAVDLEVAGELPDPSRGDLERLEESDGDARLRRAVLRLEPALVETIVLHYFQGLKFREVASLLEIPVGTVKSRLNRALDELRTVLRKEERHVGQAAREAAARTP